MTLGSDKIFPSLEKASNQSAGALRLVSPNSLRRWYQNDELVAMTRELTDTLRKNRTIDWEKREDARAKMRMMIKKLLRKYKYPPEGMEDALKTVMEQCELWTDNGNPDGMPYPGPMRETPLIAAERSEGIEGFRGQEFCLFLSND